MIILSSRWPTELRDSVWSAIKRIGSLARSAFWRWWAWFLSNKDEFHRFRDVRSRSIFMTLMGIWFWVLRRMNFWETLKHVIPELDPHKKTPAVYTDLFIIFHWICVGLAIALEERLEAWWLMPLALWNIMQIVQVSIYHNMWRIGLFRKGHVMSTGHHPMRTLFVSVCNFLAICCLYGLCYWLLERDMLPRKLESISESIYFSFVVGATVGFGDISPSEGISRWICVSQIIVSVCMLAVVVAQSVGTLGSLSFHQSARWQSSRNRRRFVFRPIRKPRTRP